MASTGALALLLLAMATWAGPAAAATGLPPFNVTYEGEFFFGEAGLVEEGSFVATGSTGGADGSLPLTFAKVTGQRTNTFNQCEGGIEHVKWALAPALNPRPGDWFVEETSSYPAKGWKYEIAGYPSSLPVLRTIEFCGTTQGEVEEPVGELLRQGCPPPHTAECEALFANLEFAPGKTKSRTRSAAFEVNGVLTRLTIKVTVTGTAPGNATGQPSGPKGSGSPPPAQPGRRAASERRRNELKQQAKEDFGPALEAEWEAHGLGSVIGLGVGQALVSIADDLGEATTRLVGNDAGERVLTDFRIYNDPPVTGYSKLAEPASPQPVALPECGTSEGAADVFCNELRPVALQMVTNANAANAIDAAMLTTIDRDTGAIQARDYPAAAAQANHFAALRKKLTAALDAQGKAGAQFARLLRGAGCKGTLTAQQSTAAIAWARRRLVGAGVPAAKVAKLAGGALKPRAVDALGALAHPAG